MYLRFFSCSLCFHFKSPAKIQFPDQTSEFCHKYWQFGRYRKYFEYICRLLIFHIYVRLYSISAKIPSRLVRHPDRAGQYCPHPQDLHSQGAACPCLPFLRPQGRGKDHDGPHFCKNDKLFQSFCRHVTMRTVRVLHFICGRAVLLHPRTRCGV